MIFVWSSHGNGGPLTHAAMLMLFVVQLLPFLIHKEATTVVDNTRATTYSVSYSISTDDQIPWFTLGLTIFVCFTVSLCLVALKIYHFWVWLRTPYADIPMEQVLGERVEREEMQEQAQPNQPAQLQQPNQPQDDEDYNQSSQYWLTMGLAAGLGVGCFVWSALFNNNIEDPFVAQKLSEIAWTLGSMLQFGGFCYMLLRDHRAQNRANHHQQYRSRTSIKSIIRCLPVEEFVKHEEEIYSNLKISRLKFMLHNRGDTSPYLEKKEMVAALLQLRKYDSSCCICYEDYKDCFRKHPISMLRILPKCGHEFHLDCLDKWAYTFEHKPEPPSCPLCKTEFE